MVIQIAFLNSPQNFSTRECAHRNDTQKIGIFIQKPLIHIHCNNKDRQILCKLEYGWTFLFFLGLLISTEKFKALVDTGASNSLIHESVAEKLNINITPTTMRLSTATGSSTNAITGTTHLNFNLSPDNVIPTTFCTHFAADHAHRLLQFHAFGRFTIDSDNHIFYHRLLVEDQATAQDVRGCAGAGALTNFNR